MSGNGTGAHRASLTLIHTVAALADTFNELLSQVAPDVPVRHVVREELLRDALAAGELTADVRRRTSEAVLAEAGKGPGVVLCTCSTVGPGADDARASADIPVLRIDRPMAEEAVRLGRRIVVTATVDTTIGPTVELLEETARRLDREVELVPVVFESAREKLLAGDSDAYVRIVADGLHGAAADADVIVLAQASMAPALEFCGDVHVPILTSPRSGLEAAVKAYRERVG